VQYTPDSLLTRATTHTPLFIGRRRRLATCSGVGWFHDRCIATVNLLGNAVHTYRFEPARRVCTRLQTMVYMDGLAAPENLAFSPDGRWVAITNSADGAVNVYRIDPRTHLIDTAPAATTRHASDVNTHGVGFSPCSRYLAFTTVDHPGYVRLFRVVADDRGGVELVSFQHIENRRAPLKPKGLAFSPDGRFVLLSYAANASRARRVPHGLIAVHAFHDVIDEQPSAVYRGTGRLRLDNPDDVAFLTDGRLLIVTDQARDVAAIVGFDPATGRIGPWRATLGNPEAQLSFPHGVDASADGRYVAIASYGDDKLTVYGTQTLAANGTSPRVR
jgi:6-phosphogluconolactonase (cycloisomerase 2 family)